MMKKFYKLCLMVLPVIAFGQDYSISSIPENLLVNANAVIRESSEDYIMKSVNEMLVKETRAIDIGQWI